MTALRRSAIHTTQPSLTRLIALVERWLDRRRERRALLALDDRLLKDIGLSPADVWHEGHKPFWRE